MSPAAAVDSIRSLSIISWTLAVALVIGMLLAWPMVTDRVELLYDATHPVSTARVLEQRREGDSLLIRIGVTRHRGECKLLGRYASAVMPVGPAQRAYADRVDGQTPGDVPVGLEIDVGWWRIWPVAGAKRVELWTYYDCDGRRVGLLFLEVAP